MFKKCSPAQPQNSHTDSLPVWVLFDADAQLEKVVASTPCSVACMAHMLHHSRGRVLGSPRFVAPPHNCQGSQAIFGQLPVTFPCLSPQPPPPPPVTACCSYSNPTSCMRSAHATGPCAGRPILSKTYPNPTICTKCAAIGLDMGPAPQPPCHLQRHLSHVRRNLPGANFRHAFFKW